MKTKNNPDMSWKEALLSTKGPATLKDSLILFIKGLFMGAANIIPGVSGGTIALITGIYQELLFAIRSADINTIRYLKRLQLKQALNTIHIRFLFILFAGAAVAIFSLAHLMNYVFKTYAVLTWSFFFGLIIASIVVMGLRTQKWIGSGGIAFLLGTVSAYLFVGLIPVSTPESWWFILLAGGVTICTMILPGLSGAFLLLILGKYEYITSAIKNPFALDNFIILTLFLIGCVLGIIAFSRLLSFMLLKHENATMAFLTGIMCGSLRKVWPWKEVLETQIIRGKEYIISEANIMPAQFGTEFFLAILLAVVGLVLVLLLERTAGDQ
jgi:putative membrane protein